MNGLLAFCENPACGTIFIVKNIFGGPGSARIEMINTRVGPCPSCGSMGLIPDGTYNYVNTAIQFLTGPQVSVERLKIVEQLLRSASQQKSSIEEVLIKIRREDPQAADWFSNLLPAIKNSAQWIAVLIALIALAIQIQTSYFNNDSDIKDKFIQHLLEDQNSLQIKQQPFYREEPKIPPNEPCPCGSGLKYKKCCGTTR